MSKKLLITEKPSVAMEFAKALKITAPRKNGYIESNEWIITWCVGHLVTMSYPEKYDEKLKFWRLDTLPFIPKEWKYEVISNVQNQFNIVQGLMQREDVEEIYNAGDSGREGEYIQRLVLMMAHPNPKAKVKRVWIDSQTEEEILRGIREAKDSSEYDSLSDSAYLRAKEDYLIGINFSRLLSITQGRTLANKINEEKASISVGRVMTCVLGMIVSREREIRNFVKTKYYKIVGEFGDENSAFKAEWKVNEKSKLFESPLLYNETGFKSEQKAKDFIVSLQGKKAIIAELKKSKQKENAPLLFNLAEIQNECTKRFKIKPEETLDVIQNLYEKKLVTYPRTDARVLSTAVAKEISRNLNGIAKGFRDEEIQGFIKKMVEEKYPTNNLAKTKYVNDSKITDHYAIIPTGQGYENYEKDHFATFDGAHARGRCFRVCRDVKRNGRPGGKLRRSDGAERGLRHSDVVQPRQREGLPGGYHALRQRHLFDLYGEERISGRSRHPLFAERYEIAHHSRDRHVHRYGQFRRGNDCRALL